MNNPFMDNPIMNSQTLINGVMIDEIHLTIDELACACVVERTWIVEHVQEGLLSCATTEISLDESDWRFASLALSRARKLISFERDFDANPEVAALLVDLLEEIAMLKLAVKRHQFGR